MNRITSEAEDRIEEAIREAKMNGAIEKARQEGWNAAMEYCEKLFRELRTGVRS